MKTIRIGGVPEHFNLPWHLAIEEGIFKREGINLEWVDFPDGTGAMNKALRSNDIQMAVILTGGIIKDIANGNPSRILQVYVSSPLLWGVHVAASSGLTTIDQLEEKKAAISRYGSGSHVMAYLQAEKQQWNTDALKFEVVGTLDKAVTALTQGTADYFMWEHFTTKPLVDQGIFRRITDFPTPWSCFVLAATMQTINTRLPEIEKIQHIINTVTQDFKDIPSIDRTLSLRYEQRLEDIRKWLSLTTWSQESISEAELTYVQDRLIKLKMISRKLDLTSYLR